MSAVRTMCPHCITSVDLDPAEILLIGTREGDDTGSYAYARQTCQRPTANGQHPVSVPENASNRAGNRPETGAIEKENRRWHRTSSTSRA